MVNTAKPYHGAEADITFENWDTGEVRDTAIFGEFRYYPKRLEKEFSSNRFSFRLRHVAEDARDLLIPLLTQQVETSVRLTVNVTNGEEELLAATDKLGGNVRDYSFEVRRQLVNDGALDEKLSAENETS